MLEINRGMFDELARKGMRAMIEAEDRMVRESIIGSKILDIKFEPIKNRKTMMLLTIKTDAPPVSIGDHAYIDCSTLRVRIKWKS